MNFKEAYTFATDLCAKQERCSSQIEEKLIKLQTDKDVINEVIAKLKAERFLDDLRYATYFTKDKYRFEKWGKIKITFQLKQKKLTSEIIAEALEVIDENQYTANLVQIIETAKRKIKEPNEYKKKSKIARLAASKGYESTLIFKHLNLESDE